MLLREVSAGLISDSPKIPSPTIWGFTGLPPSWSRGRSPVLGLAAWGDWGPGRGGPVTKRRAWPGARGQQRCRCRKVSCWVERPAVVSKKTSRGKAPSLPVSTAVDAPSESRVSGSSPWSPQRAPLLPGRLHLRPARPTGLGASLHVADVIP